MNTRQNNNFIIGHRIDQAIREFAQPCATGAAIHLLILKWITHYLLNRRFNGTKQFVSQVLVLLIVPIGGFGKLKSSFGTNNERAAHLRRDQSHARTSSQGIADDGSRSCSSSRRSISAFCSAVSGGSSSACALSKSSCPSSMRSSSLNSNSSLNRALLIKCTDQVIVSRMICPLCETCNITPAPQVRPAARRPIA